MVKQAIVADYDDAVTIAKQYVKSSYGRVSEVQIKRAWMEPHWEEGLWIVELSFKHRPKLLSKAKRIKLRLKIDPISGEVRDD